MKILGVAAAMSLALVADQTSAATYLLNVSGKVTDTFAFSNSDQNPPIAMPVPVGLFEIGSDYTLTASFDINPAPTSLYDSDPTINIYYLSNANITISIGSFSTSFSPTYDFNASLQIWNDRQPFSSDAQSFSFFDYNPQLSQYPFDLGSGTYSISIDADMFDNSGTARDNDLYTELAPPTAFSSKIGSFGLLNSSGNQFVGAWLGVTDYSLTTDVPELATWQMMVGGFGFVGFSLRRRSTTLRVNS